MVKKKAKVSNEDKKDIVIFESKTGRYNDEILNAYINAQKLSPIKFGKDLGELIGFIKSRSMESEEAEIMLTILSRLLDVYIEAGTYNGVKKIVPFKFKMISQKQREKLIENMKKQIAEQQQKADVKIQEEEKKEIPNYMN